MRHLCIKLDSIVTVKLLKIMTFITIIECFFPEIFFTMTLNNISFVFFWGDYGHFISINRCINPYGSRMIPYNLIQYMFVKLLLFLAPAWGPIRGAHIPWRHNIGAGHGVMERLLLCENMAASVVPWQHEQQLSFHNLSFYGNHEKITLLPQIVCSMLT